MAIDELKQILVQCMQNNRDEIIEIGETIYRTPETGFREFQTAAYVRSKLDEWGVTYTNIEEYPGIKVTIDTGREGPGLAIVGELDALICPEHPDSDRETGAVHACGHNAQIAAMMGALKGLLDSGALGRLGGLLHFIAVPAEEYIEIAYRMELRERGIIQYLGGKPELLRRGYFDDVDLCISIHSTNNPNKVLALGSTLNSCVVKNIKYIGKPSHAGSTPYLKSMRSMRQTSDYLQSMPSGNVQREECIRCIPLYEGDIVNVIPGDVRIETFVRGKTLKDMLRASIRVDRALAGAAMAIGADVVIEDLPGYLPASYDANLQAIALEVGGALAGESKVGIDVHDTGSTDWGDISSLMPVLEAYVAGISGTAHAQIIKSLIRTQRTYWLQISGIYGGKSCQMTQTRGLFSKLQAAVFI